MTDETSTAAVVVETKTDEIINKEEAIITDAVEEESKFIKDCKTLFGSLNLYEILGIAKEATKEDGNKLLFFFKIIFSWL